MVTYQVRLDVLRCALHKYRNRLVQNNESSDGYVNLWDKIFSIESLSPLRGVFSVGDILPDDTIVNIPGYTVYEFRRCGISLNKNDYSES